jgi:hypothetical protein
MSDDEGSGGGGEGGEDNQQAVYFLYIAGFAGMMVMAQAAALIDQFGEFEPPYGSGYLDYAVALGTITLVAALVMYALIHFGQMNDTMQKGFGWFLLVWNGVGAGVTTFGHPFNIMGVTPNGYFGVWVSLFISAALLSECYNAEKTDAKAAAVRAQMRKLWDRLQEKTMVSVMFLASVVTLVVGAIMCGESDCAKIRGFGVAFGTINTVMSGVFAYLQRTEPAQYRGLPNVLFLVYAIWWVAGFLSLTLFVNARFYTLGNGYLASLVGTIAAVNIASSKQKSANRGDAAGDDDGYGDV